MRPAVPRPPKALGFTIMEVMIAIMLLAISVVSIFGAQFAAIATTEFSKYTTQAIQLAKCRMNEIELEVLTEGGFEEADVISSGECCEVVEGEDSIRGFECEWEVKPIDMPDISQLMAQGAADGGSSLLDEMGLGGSSDDIEGAMDDMGMMGMASSLFGPMLSDMLREGIRRVKVKVKWQQGSKEREFVLSQYIVHPTQGLLGLMTQAATASEQAEDIEMMKESGELPPDFNVPGMTR